MRAFAAAAAIAIGCVCAPGHAADLKINPGDNVEAVLTAQKDKRVTLRLRSGQELTGVLKMVSPKLVQLSVLGGREYFDAVIPATWFRMSTAMLLLLLDLKPPWWVSAALANALGGLLSSTLLLPGPARTSARAARQWAVRGDLRVTAALT